MKKLYFRNSTLLAVLLLFTVISATQLSAQQGKSFKWTMTLQNEKTGTVPFSAPVQSANGERFKILIKPDVKSFVYIIAEDPEGEVTVLYTGAMKSNVMWSSDFLELTSPQGSESLYIVASLEEQKALAQRIDALEENAGTTQKRALINEVLRIRSETSKFKEAPEKPVLMGGATRGSEESEGIEFSGLRTYVKTISIEH